MCVCVCERERERDLQRIPQSKERPASKTQTKCRENSIKKTSSNIVKEMKCNISIILLSRRNFLSPSAQKSSGDKMYTMKGHQGISVQK